VTLPGDSGGRRSDTLASTLDVFPTILDALKVSYPPDLAGRSLLPAAQGRAGPGAERLLAQNERNLTSSFDARFKLVATPQAERVEYALYDRRTDPRETRDASRARPEERSRHRREIELFQERHDGARRDARRRRRCAKRMSAEPARSWRPWGTWLPTSAVSRQQSKPQSPRPDSPSAAKARNTATTRPTPRRPR
jgi:hypothetical protein